RIAVAQQPSLNAVYAVAGDGTIDFPYIGRIQVEDKTPGSITDQIEENLNEKFFKAAEVDVAVAEYVEGNISVIGAVRNPGPIAFSSDKLLTLFEAIIERGGFANNADGTKVRIIRWKPGGGMGKQIIESDVQSMLDSLTFDNDQFLRPRDIIMVPSLGQTEGQNEFLALGEVGSTGFHPWSEGLNMIRALTRIGSYGREALLDAVKVPRPSDDGSYNVIAVNVSRLLGQADMTMNIPIFPGDILFFPSKDQATGGQVYLLGEVANPTILPLPLDKKITLARLLLTTNALTDFSRANAVKIARKAPDGTRQELSVDVASILKTGRFEDDVKVQPEDIIIVPAKIVSVF
ncbi:MAG: polysaccharide biosynthesis/export family protein, partial [Verrucomicrobiota bacterium]